jgi:hypothetical protein
MLRSPWAPGAGAEKGLDKVLDMTDTLFIQAEDDARAAV